MEKTTVEAVDVDDEVSGLDFEETVLKLGLPGVRGGGTKRGFSDSDLMSSDDDGSVESMASNDSGRYSGAKARVVGWPPVRSFRKNALKSCNYVKVAVDGAPYLRKVDLESYDGYEQLLTALGGMFFCLEIRYSKSDRKLVDPVNGTEYAPTYEDKDGDWMLAGDVPWKMFVESCKRLRLMKRSDAPRQASLFASPFA